MDVNLNVSFPLAGRNRNLDLLFAVNSAYLLKSCNEMEIFYQVASIWLNHTLPDSLCQTLDKMLASILRFCCLSNSFVDGDSNPL